MFDSTKVMARQTHVDKDCHLAACRDSLQRVGSLRFPIILQLLACLTNKGAALNELSLVQISNKSNDGLARQSEISKICDNGDYLDIEWIDLPNFTFLLKRETSNA